MRLASEGKITIEKPERYTVEEIDRARRLIGMTMLDLSTGCVTEKKDQAAASDSYYFLSPKRRREVIQQEQEILTVIETISQAAIVEHETSRDILPALAAYADGKLTTPKLQAQYKAVLERTTEPYFLSLASQIKALKQVAFETGRWDRILTPQEIMLRAGGVVDPKYLVQPHIPLAIQDGADMEEIVRLRQGEQSMVVNAILLGYTRPFGFRLEELDEQGNTIKSPTFLDHEDGETLVEDEDFRTYLGPQVNFPFARPSDWFYKESEPSDPKEYLLE